MSANFLKKSRFSRSLGSLVLLLLLLISYWFCVHASELLVCVCYQRSCSQTGAAQCFQLLCHLGGQSLKVASSVLLITDPGTIDTHVNTERPLLVHNRHMLIQSAPCRWDSPLDDLCDLSLPVSHALLLGRQILQVVLQLTILSRQFIHK